MTWNFIVGAVLVLLKIGCMDGLSVLTCVETCGVVQVGDVIKMTCCYDDDNKKSTNQDLLYITHSSLPNRNGSVIQSDRLNTSCSVATVKANGPEQDGIYTCHHGDDSVFDSTQYVYVKMTAKPLLHCVIKEDYLYLSCEWSALDDKWIRNRWSLMYKKSNNRYFRCCTETPPTFDCSCQSPDNCARPPEHCGCNQGRLYCNCTQLTDARSCRIDEPGSAIYEFVLNKLSRTGPEVLDVTISVDDSILELGVDYVDVEARQPRQLVVAFGIDRSTESGAVCNLTLTPEYVTLETSRRVIEIHRLFTDWINTEKTVTVSGLSPYTRYNSSVTCRLPVSPYWGQPRYTSGATLAEPPVALPKLIGYSVGDVNSTDDTQNVYLYFKANASDEYLGPSPMYHITTADSQTNLTFPVSMVTASVPMDVSSLCMRVALANEAGVSTDSVVLNVTNEENNPYVVVSESEQGYYVQLFNMNSSDTSTNLEFIFCYGERHINQPPECKSPVKISKRNWTMFSEIYFIPNADGPLVDKQRFYGVAIGSNPGQIAWSNCVFENKESGMAEISPADIPISVSQMISSGEKGSSSSNSKSSNIKVDIRYDYCDLPVMPINYTIIVESIDDAQSQYEQHVFPANPVLKQVIVNTSLALPVSVRLNISFLDGQYGTSDEISLDPVYLRDFQVTSSSKPQSHVALVVGICVGIAVVIAICATAYKVRSCYLDRKKALSVPNSVIERIHPTVQADDSYQDCSSSNDVASYQRLHLDSSGDTINVSISDAIDNERCGNQNPSELSAQKNDEQYKQIELQPNNTKEEEKHNEKLFMVTTDINSAIEQANSNTVANYVRQNTFGITTISAHSTGNNNGKTNTNNNNSEKTNSENITISKTSNCQNNSNENIENIESETNNSEDNNAERKNKITTEKTCTNSIESYSKVKQTAQPSFVTSGMEVINCGYTSQGVIIADHADDVTEDGVEEDVMNRAAVGYVSMTELGSGISIEMTDQSDMY